MLTYHEHASANNCNTFFQECQVKPADDSKIPFQFAAIPHHLFDKGLDPSTVGVYCGLARYVNWKAQMTVDGRKIITGWTIPVTQERLADLLNTSRQTIIRKIKVLEQADVIEYKKSFRGCYQYRLIAYKEGIEALEAQQEERRQREQDGMSHPGAPTPEQVEDYIKAETSTQNPRSQSKKSDVPNFDTICHDLRHIKEMLRKIESKTLSSGDDTPNEESEPKQDDREERVDEEEWKNYEKYAQAFYGTIRPKKFKREVCLYFKNKVEEFGFASDGTDRILQVIMKVKALGCRVHTVMDKEFGVRAYNMVLDEEETRIRRKRDEEQQKAQKEKQHAQAETPHEPKQEGEESHKDSASPDHKENNSSNNPTGERGTPEPDNTDDPDDPRDYHLDLRELWKMAPQSVRRVIYRLENHATLVKAVDEKPYTAEEIEAIWQNAYRESGWPKKAGEWFHHRILCHEILKAKRLVGAMSNEEALELLERAKVYERTLGSKHRK